VAQGALLKLPERGLVGGMYNSVSLAELPSAFPAPELVEIYQHSWFIHLNYHGPKPQILPLSDAHGRHTFVPQVGIVSFVIRLGDYLDTVEVSVDPLPAVIRVGGYSHKDDVVKGIVLRAQRGLYAVIENYDINARCSVKAYEAVVCREAKMETFSEAGGVFSEALKEALKSIKAGDLVVFRRISYQCTGSGAVQRSPNLVFRVE